MKKNIILLSDGTGNSSHDPFKTNVWRLYQALDLNRREAQPNDPDQIACYDDGVGTSSFQPLALLGGAFGYGLKRNVLDLYTFLCRNYKEGDQIYCFGFSRGAFTVRVLAALICSQGLVQADTEAELQKMARAAFREYRRSYHTHRSPLNPFNLLGMGWRWIRDKFHSKYDSTKNLQPESQYWIRFLGVWDTVAAYGLPVDELTRAWDAVFPLSFPNRKLNERVQRACHALALDDERQSFHPEVWTEDGQTTHDRLLQVWFAGMHSDVGGSYPDDAMSFVPLEWMLGQASQAGLRFKALEQTNIEAAANKFGPIHDSRSGTGGFYRYYPRKLEKLLHDKEAGVHVSLPKIHESVFERIREGTDGYAPVVLPDRYAVYTRKGDIIWQEENSQPQQAKCSSDSITWQAAASSAAVLPESPAKARLRGERQENIWNLVWKKRVVYFLSVLAAFGLALFPLYRPATAACEGLACFAAPAIKALAFVLPGFAAPLLKAYESHPGSFLLLLIAFVLLLSRSSALQCRIFDGMRKIWAGNPLPQHMEKPSGGIYGLRENAGYKWFVRLNKNWLLPLVAGLLAAWMIVGGVSHFVFTMFESAGCVCLKSEKSEQILKDTTKKFNDEVAAYQQALAKYELAKVKAEPAQPYEKPPELPVWPVEFESKKTVCWSSGYWFEEGSRYRLTLKASDDWADNTIQSDIGGFQVGEDKISWTSKLAFYSFFWLRRDLGESWFQPMARIGHYGHDEYPLHPTGSAEKKTLVTEITARRNGELFLFLNDAALPVPNDWQYFYGNNHGKLTVQIELLDAKGK